mgnify:CR=1 FL=1
MNRKLLLLLALLLFSYGLSSCSSDDNSPSEGKQTDTPELFTKRYNPDQSFYMVGEGTKVHGDLQV